MREASEHTKPDTVPYFRAERSQTPKERGCWRGCDPAERGSRGDRLALCPALLMSKQGTDSPWQGSMRGDLPKCFCVFFSGRPGFPGGEERNEKSKELLWL